MTTTPEPDQVAEVRHHEVDVAVERVDRYTIVVDGARIRATDEQEHRIRALSAAEQRRLASILGGRDG